MKLNKLIIALALSASNYDLYAGTPIEPIMVSIPSGSFEMGSTKRKSTQPVHKVKIEQFSMGKYEVTVNEFRQFMEATNYQAPQECRHEMDSWFLLWTKGNWETNALNTSEYQPVVCINWKAANAYANWLAKETGKPYRLPSEAEWEYAARAGTKTDYFFGNDSSNTQVCDYANTSDLSGENILQRDSNTSYYNFSGEIAKCVDHSGYASIVGMYKPNQFGLHDVLSNVLEFLADCYEGDYNNAPLDGSANITDKCERRATRGGSWHWSHWPLAYRSSQSETFSGGVDGFRLALDGDAPELSNESKQFLANLNFAQEQEQKRRDLKPDYPDAVTNLKLKQTNKAVTLTWDYSEDSFLVSYRVYRNAVSGKRFKLIATNLTNTQFIDANAEPNKYEYTVVAVKQNVQSHYSAPVEKKSNLINIPGKIEAEWASEFNGSLITYGEYDDRYGFSLEAQTDNKDKAILKYQLNASKSGKYKLKYHISSPEDLEGFEIYTNDKISGVSNIVKTGTEKEWQTQQSISVFLEKGKNTLTLKSLNNNWKLDWLELNQD